MVKMLDRITLPISMAPDQPGAVVEVRDYASPDTPWVRLGETPLEGIRIPYALTHWRISKAGFEVFEGAPFGIRPFDRPFGLSTVRSKRGIRA